MLCNLSFSGTMWGGYKFSKQSNKNVKAFHRKKERLNTDLVQRLQNVDVECRDAIAVIKSRDTETSFFYVDPPYIVNKDQQVHQGHYSWYSPEDYIVLLDTLSQLKGKFLLSNYPSDILNAYIQRNGRSVMTQESKITANRYENGQPRKTKTELLVANYSLDSVEYQK